MQATLIVNPFASRVTEELVRAIEAELQPVETLLTERRSHAIELSREAAGGEVWVLGGDGLVNEVLNGLRAGVALGVIPGGHSNVFARLLQVTAGPLRTRRPRVISLGRVNGRRFGFAAGIGVDSEAVRAMETEKRAHEGKRPGDTAYARDIATRLLRGSEPRLELRGLGRAAAVFASKASTYTFAGPVPIRLSTEAQLELGVDVVALERIDTAALIRLVPRLITGRGLAGAPGVISAHDLDRLEVVCDAPLPLQADGEDLGDVTEAVFETERDAVSVLV